MLGFHRLPQMGRSGWPSLAVAALHCPPFASERRRGPAFTQCNHQAFHAPNRRWPSTRYTGTFCCPQRSHSLIQAVGPTTITSYRAKSHMLKSPHTTMQHSLQVGEAPSHQLMRPWNTLSGWAILSVGSVHT